MSWIKVGATVASAGASYFSNRRSGRTEERGQDRAAAFQNRALDTQLAVSRPQLEVGNSALAVLAQLFGLPAPPEINFGGLSSSGVAGSPFTPGGALTGAQQDVLASYIESFGYSPIQSPEQAARTKTSDFRSNRHRDDWLAFQTAFGYDPHETRGNPFLDPQQQQAAPAATGIDLESLVTNNPLIEYKREQGEKAIARGAAARGLNESGGTLQELAEFSDKLAGAGVQQFVIDPLFELAGYGPRASAQVSSAAGNVGNNLSNIALERGNTRSSAFQNEGTILSNTIGNLYDIYQNRSRGGSNSGPNLLDFDDLVPNWPFRR